MAIDDKTGLTRIAQNLMVAMESSGGHVDVRFKEKITPVHQVITCHAPTVEPYQFNLIFSTIEGYLDIIIMHHNIIGVGMELRRFTTPKNLYAEEVEIKLETGYLKIKIHLNDDLIGTTN